jgi:Subtilase family
MTLRSKWRIPAVLLLLPALSTPRAQGAGGELWRASLHELVEVTIEKQVEQAALQKLPDEIVKQAGKNALDYEGFLVTYLPEAEALALVEAAQRRGLTAGISLDREIRLSFHTFQPGDPLGRHDARVTSRVAAQAVPGLYLVQFAYPIRQDWLDSLAACGVEREAYFQSRTFLVRAPNLATLTGCAPASYFSWIDAFAASDRMPADLLTAQPNPLGYWLQFPGGADLTLKVRELPRGMTVLETYQNKEDKVSYLRVQASADDLTLLASIDPDLLTISSEAGSDVSDERQGWIVAGNITGGSTLCSPNDPAHCSYPHYRDWLSSRGLLTNLSQQEVAVLDVGFDNGKAPGDPGHHPDFENACRLEGAGVYSGSTLNLFDKQGHGTMVAGIIAGDGQHAPFSTDAQGFYPGSGIAPGAKIFAYKITTTGDLSLIEQGLNAARTQSTGADRALIVNQSWNESKIDQNSSAVVPDPTYTLKAQTFDFRVRDASTAVSGDQPMTIVFSAGNHAYNCVTGQIGWNSVSSPAVAKNVIAVGATESYRPAPQPPLACSGCFGSDGLPNGRPPDVNATNVNAVANFSGRGVYFAKAPSQALAHNTRIKPDLVAPGVRVSSIVPYNSVSYDIQTFFTGCAKYYSYPSTTNTYHSYGSGTSFAAPVVSGVAAIARKWFQSLGTNASPSLIKAALIATADSLGNSGLPGHDHRPSPLYGWGRVNLARLTDSVQRFFASASDLTSVGTGGTYLYNLRVSNPALPVYVVLVWDDPPAGTVGTQPALVNDLSLNVGGGLWRGNMFNENMAGVDDSYSYRFNVGVSTNDAVNNVEAVFLPPATFTSGQAVPVRVTGVNVPQGNAQGRQPFSVYAYNLVP